MSLCARCNDLNKISQNRQNVMKSHLTGNQMKSYSSLHGPGWHRESYWHSQAAIGRSIPKVRQKV
jgi:hypothetical protein